MKYNLLSKDIALMIKKILFVFLALLLLGACNNGKVKKSLLPGVSGKAGEVLVIMDKPLWKGSNGESLKKMLLQDTPGLPQSEPIFNPVNISRNAFSSIFQIHRTIMIFQTGEEFIEPKITVEYDVWAQPQLVIKLSALNSSSLHELLDENEEKILGVLFKGERDRLMANYTKYAERGIVRKLEDRKGIHLTIPKSYTYDLDTNNFVWISHETPSISQGIMVYHYPYVDDSTFTLDYLITKRNEILKQYVSGEGPGTYMTTEDQIPSIFRAYNWKGDYTAEVRGLWKVQGDFMGGPFVSLSRINEYTNEVVTVEGYVYAPKYDKRNYMRQLEAILYSLSFIDPNASK